MRSKSAAMSDKELAKEEKIQEIITKHQKYLQPIEIVDINYENIDTKSSVIIDDDEDLTWNFADRQETKKYEEDPQTKELKRKETKAVVESMRRASLVKKYSYKTKSHITDLCNSFISDVK